MLLSRGASTEDQIINFQLMLCLTALTLVVGTPATRSSCRHTCTVPLVTCPLLMSTRGLRVWMHSLMPTVMIASAISSMSTLAIRVLR